MARGWRVLDATSFEGVVTGTRGRIRLKGRDGTAQEVPAEEAAVLLIGNKVAITAAALHYLAKHDVVLVGADWRGAPFAGLYPWSSHGRVAARHLAQADLTLPRKKNAWMQLIRAKITGQAATLTTVDPVGAVYLEHLAKNVRS
jgi:CRISPR-associated protein Cas1